MKKKKKSTEGIFSARTKAYIVDVVIDYLIMGVFLLNAYLEYLNDPASEFGFFQSVCLMITIIFLFIYIPTKSNGQTLGKMIFKIRVVNQSGKKRNAFQNFVREFIVKIVLGMFVVPATLLHSLIFKKRLKNGYTVLLHDDYCKTEVEYL